MSTPSAGPGHIDAEADVPLDFMLRWELALRRSRQRCQLGWWQ
jgi:hypothetical protein